MAAAAMAPSSRRREANMNARKPGKDRAKHDGGKDASGKVPDGAKHPESERPSFDPRSGAPGTDREHPASRDRELVEDE
jgi:hypothetical protein